MILRVSHPGGILILLICVLPLEEVVERMSSSSLDVDHMLLVPVDEASYTAPMDNMSRSTFKAISFLFMLSSSTKVELYMKAVAAPADCAPLITLTACSPSFKKEQALKAKLKELLLGWILCAIII